MPEVPEVPLLPACPAAPNVFTLHNEYVPAPVGVLIINVITPFDILYAVTSPSILLELS